MGGAEIWRITGTGYLSGTPKKTPDDWPSEWFYIEDVPLPDLMRVGLYEFVLRLELALVFLEEERVMQQSTVSISLSF